MFTHTLSIESQEQHGRTQVHGWRVYRMASHARCFSLTALFHAFHARYFLLTTLFPCMWARMTASAPNSAASWWRAVTASTTIARVKQGERFCRPLSHHDFLASFLCRGTTNAIWCRHSSSATCVLSKTDVYAMVTIQRMPRRPLRHFH